jgi:hypothetical protein
MPNGNASKFHFSMKYSVLVIHLSIAFQTAEQNQSIFNIATVLGSLKILQGPLGGDVRINTIDAPLGFFFLHEEALIPEYLKNQTIYGSQKTGSI